MAEVSVLTTDLRALADAQSARRADLVSQRQSDADALAALRSARARQTETFNDRFDVQAAQGTAQRTLADAQTFLSDLQAGRRNVADEQTRLELIRLADQGLVDLAARDSREEFVVNPPGQTTPFIEERRPGGEAGVPGSDAGFARAFERGEITQQVIERRAESTAQRQSREQRLDALAEERRQEDFVDRLETRRFIGAQDLENEIQDDTDLQQFYADQDLLRGRFIDNANRIERRREIDQLLSDREFIADIQLERERDGEAFVQALADEADQVALNDRILDDRAVAREPLERAAFGENPLAAADQRRDFVNQLQDRIQSAEALDSQLRRAFDQRAATDAAIARATGLDVGLPAVGEPAPPPPAADPPDGDAPAPSPLLRDLPAPDPLNARPVEIDDEPDPLEPQARSESVEQAREDNIADGLDALRQERLDDRSFNEALFFEQQAVDIQLADDAIEAAIFDPGSARGSIFSVAG